MGVEENQAERGSAICFYPEVSQEAAPEHPHHGCPFSLSSCLGSPCLLPALVIITHRSPASRVRENMASWVSAGRTPARARRCQGLSCSACSAWEGGSQPPIQTRQALGPQGRDASAGLWWVVMEASGRGCGFQHTQPPVIT